MKTWTRRGAEAKRSAGTTTFNSTCFLHHTYSKDSFQVNILRLLYTKSIKHKYKCIFPFSCSFFSLLKWDVWPEYGILTSQSRERSAWGNASSTIRKNHVSLMFFLRKNGWNPPIKPYSLSQTSILTFDVAWGRRAAAKSLHASIDHCFPFFAFYFSLLREHSIDGTGWAPTRTLKVNASYFVERVYSVKEKPIGTHRLLVWPHISLWGPGALFLGLSGVASGYK